MSTTEAQQRLLAAVMARAFSDEQIQLLLGAEIGYAEGPLALQDPMAQLSPQVVQRHITRCSTRTPNCSTSSSGCSTATGFSTHRDCRKDAEPSPDRREGVATATALVRAGAVIPGDRAALRGVSPRDAVRGCPSDPRSTPSVRHEQSHR